MKKFFYYSTIIFLMTLLFLLNILYAKITSQYDDNKKQLIILQKAIKNNHKDNHKNIYYNNIIHTANKYNGEIKEFRGKNENINAVITMPVTGNSVNGILEKLQEEESINRINSISLESKRTEIGVYTILLNADFSNGDI